MKTWGEHEKALTTFLASTRLHYPWNHMFSNGDLPIRSPASNKLYFLTFQNTGVPGWIGHWKRVSAATRRISKVFRTQFSWRHCSVSSFFIIPISNASGSFLGNWVYVGCGGLGDKLVRILSWKLYGIRASELLVLHWKSLWKRNIWNMGMFECFSPGIDSNHNIFDVSLPRTLTGSTVFCKAIKKMSIISDFKLVFNDTNGFLLIDRRWVVS